MLGPYWKLTYLSGGDHDTNLFDSLGELIWFNCSIVVQIEVLESFKEDSLLIGVTSGLLGQLLLKCLLETEQTKRYIQQILFTQFKHHRESVGPGQGVHTTLVDGAVTYLCFKPCICFVFCVQNFICYNKVSHKDT